MEVYCNWVKPLCHLKSDLRILLYSMTNVLFTTSSCKLCMNTSSTILRLRKIVLFLYVFYSYICYKGRKCGHHGKKQSYSTHVFEPSNCQYCVW